MSPVSSHDAAHRGPVWVALDLETTGLDSATDAIIEVGAVKFHGDEAVGTFHRLVNPGRPLPEFIQARTGITPGELESAASFGSIADELTSFVGAAPVIGHNIAFDLAFLRQAGLQLAGPAYDTYDLASVLFPSLSSYSLVNVAQALGVAHDRPHRALGDAEATMAVFQGFLRELGRLPAPVLHEIRRIADRSDWSLRLLFRQMPPVAADAPERAEPGLEGLDLRALGELIPENAS